MVGDRIYDKACVDSIECSSKYVNKNYLFIETKEQIKEVVKEVKVPVEVPAKNPAFYVQYQSAEYTVAAITERVIADCNAKGHAVENPEALSIYLKPEDKKAYYTLGGFNGYIEL